MANIRRGEYPLTINGLDFVLRFDMNALAELEGVLNEPLGQILEDAENKMSFRFLRAALYAGVASDKRFAKKRPTLEKIGALITMENYADIMKGVIVALTSALTGKTPDEIENTLDKSPAVSSDGGAEGSPFDHSTGPSTE